MPNVRCYTAPVLPEAKRCAPAAPDTPASLPGGSSRGTPRYATHLWVLTAALLVSAVAPLSLHRASGDAVASARADRALLRAAGQDALLKPDPRAKTALLPALKNYVVQGGDTVPAIASRAGISLETLIQVNHLISGDDLTVGEVLVVPPVDGSMAAVLPGQSLVQIADAHKADPAAIRAANHLALGAPLPNELFIPTASTPEAPARAAPIAPSENRRHLVRFVWPTQGAVTQSFWKYHPGIDIANAWGTPEVAADGGRVVFAGWGAYGIYVEIDHGNGFSTLYGHMARVAVSPGQTVTSGQQIGAMGCTGQCTGPHLHFELRLRGVPQNPSSYLP